MVVVALAIVTAGGLYLAANSEFGSERLRTEAQKRISRTLGMPVEAQIDAAGLSLDSSMFVALDVQGIEIGEAGTGRPLLRAESMSFGVRPRPLLSGRLELGHARISGGSVDLSARAAGEGIPLPASMLDANGVVSPDAVLSVLFASLHRAHAVLRNGKTSLLELVDVTVKLGDGGPLPSLRIVTASLENSGGGELELRASVEAANRTFLFETRFSEAGKARPASVLEASIEGTSPVVDGRPTELENALGAFALKVSGKETGDLVSRSLRLRLDAKEAGLKLGAPPPLQLSGTIVATLAQGTGKIEFDRIRLASGRSRFDMTGALGPQPDAGKNGIEPGYRYEFVSGRSNIEPSDSTEPALQAGFSVSGTIDPLWNRVAAESLAIDSGAGGAFGNALVELRKGMAPGLHLSLAVPQISVSQAKLLWPWFAAPGARRWAMENVFGGSLVESRVTLDVDPGFFGHGRPLDADQLQASFNIRGTRFDVAGAIPPMRDAAGRVDVRGMDIDVGLESGTVYMPSGRSVAARSGTLAIRNSDQPPLIGELNIEVAGNADAVAEIATYDPIDISRFVDLSPADLSGEVEGKVIARVPLQPGVPADRLSWQVDLSYRDLAIAKPFEGQIVTDATGTIRAEQSATTIEAKAKLNGMPAVISMFEPLGADKSQRRRNFKIELDDAGREKIAAGLSTVVSGPITVDLAMGNGTGRQSMVADLGRATLSVPWMGWKKGAGIPATATFALETTDGTTRISDFALRGESFGATGSMVIDRNGLQSARFSRLALNRGDDASLTLDRKGSRYSIDIKGKSLDVRSLVKTFDSFTGSPKGADGSSAEPVPVSIDADLENLAGFNGETMSAVKLAYSGSGSSIDTLRATATTRSGKSFAIIDAAAGGNRRVEMQAGDAGAVLRFLDIYPNMSSGSVSLSLSGPDGRPLRGFIEARDFVITNEQRLSSIVASAPPGGDKSLNDAVRSNVDVSESRFERGYAQLEKGDDYLRISEGVVRGPMIGSTFQGTVFDGSGNMNVTGTFMPAYGLNRIFGEIPLIGQILGNGRDRGLIGITYRLTGRATAPKLEINPLSVVAPGIFRSIFEYR